MMTREEAQKAAEVMLAYADGEKIECLDTNSKWIECKAPEFNWSYMKGGYRVKPKPEYDSFRDAEECWEEMCKHSPFGWLKDKDDGHYVFISRISDEIGNNISIDGNSGWCFETVIKFYTFIDGIPFGKLI